MSRGLRKVMDEHGFPDLPDEFVEWVRRKGKKDMSLAELVKEFKEWERGRT